MLFRSCVTTFCNNTLAGDNIEYEDENIVKMEYDLPDGEREQTLLLLTMKRYVIYSKYIIVARKKIEKVHVMK